MTCSKATGAPPGASSREQVPGFTGQKMFMVAAEEEGRWGERQDLKRAGGASAGEQSEREQQREAKEWFLQDLTVCFSVWCIKSCEIFRCTAFKQPKWMFSVLGGFSDLSWRDAKLSLPINKLCQAVCCLYRDSLTPQERTAGKGEKRVDA